MNALNGFWKLYGHGSQAEDLHLKEFEVEDLKVYDLYVYFVKDSVDNNPQIYMWFRDGIIERVDTSNDSLGLSQEELDVLERKLYDLGLFDKYKQHIDDQRHLDKIYKSKYVYASKDDYMRQMHGHEISEDELIEDLIFLYEINRSILHFNSSKINFGDKRVYEILELRNEADDYCLMFGSECRPFYTDENDKMNKLRAGGVMFHPYDLHIYSNQMEEVIIPPKVIDGKLDTNGLLCNTLDLSNSLINGGVGLPNPSFHILNCNNTIIKHNHQYFFGKNIDIIDLTGARVAGHFDFSINTSEQIKMSNFETSGNLNMKISNTRTIQADNMKIYGNVSFYYDNAEMTYIDLSGSEILHDMSLDFSKANIVKCNGIIVHGDFFMRNLKEINNLDLTDSKIFGMIYIYGLVEANSLIFPKFVYNGINLRCIKDVDNIVFPEKMEGDLILSSVLSIKDVKLPDYIDGNLDINSVQDLSYLNLPFVTGTIKNKGNFYTYNDLCEILGITPFEQENKNKLLM